MKQETTNKTNCFTLSGVASGIREPASFAWRMGGWGCAVLTVLVMMIFVSASASTAPAFASNCTIFPADNVWHADVSELLVQPRSDTWISSMGGSRQLLHSSSEACPGILEHSYTLWSIVERGVRVVEVCGDCRSLIWSWRKGAY
jgi:hypothetical protein